MWNEQIIMMLLEGIKDTLYMTLTSTLIGYVIGLPMGILLTVTDKDGIHPNAELILLPRRCAPCWRTLATPTR